MEEAAFPWPTLWIWRSGNRVSSQVTSCKAAGPSFSPFLAETPGFEPGVPHSGYDGLANRWFQPLTHVSGVWLALAYSEGIARDQPIDFMRFGAGSTRLVALFIAGTGGSDSKHCSLGSGEFSMAFAFKFKTLLLALLLCPTMASAQMTSVDPNTALGPATPPPASMPAVPAAPADPVAADVATGPNDAAAAPAPSASDTSVPGKTYRKDDLIGAAEGVFGKGAKGLAEMIEKILKDQGEPNAYIAGREASAAFVVGLRYGSGTMKHAVEGERAVYWTGPSVGFDVGGDAANVFVLVYNLYDSQDLYRRYPQVEGRAYFVGGLSATYLRRGSVVLIPVRLGAGVRLGANIGYMKFSEKSKWLPF